MSCFVRTAEAKKRLGVSDVTLRAWAESGKINFIRPTKNSNRLYDVDSFIKAKSNHSDSDFVEEDIKSDKRKIIYCRVSSASQRDDLQRQVDYLKIKYPDHDIIKDTASGINFKRKGLNKILALAMQRSIDEIVVAHKDRLCRIAWDHFEWLFKNLGVNIIIEDNQEHSPESEFTEDLFSIIHVFSSRHYGMRRKYTSK
jgi:putative resolvase